MAKTKKTGQTKDSWSPRGPCGPGTVGTMPSCGLIKNFFCCVSLSACSICRGTIGASPGPNLSAQSAAAPCNIYTGCLHGLSAHNITTIQLPVWSDVTIKVLQASRAICICTLTLFQHTGKFFSSCLAKYKISSFKKIKYQIT